MIKPGQPQVWQEGNMFEKGLTIINFPTKNHWKNPDTEIQKFEGIVFKEEEPNGTVVREAL